MIPQNIKINNVRSLDAKLVNDEYYDFMLYKGEVYGAAAIDDCLATSIDLSNPLSYTEDGGVQSLSSWGGSTNEGVELDKIGWVGVDNGLIAYDKDAITNKIFLRLFFDSILTIESGDTKFHMNAVTGNTKAFSYDISIEKDENGYYAACKGGFLQGFFKTYGYDYQVLPDHIENDWHFEFVIRPRTDYETKENVMNNTYPGNAGTFFFIGARAENKFAELYNRTSAYTDNYKMDYSDPELNALSYYQYDDPEYPTGGDVDIFRTKERELANTYLHSDGDVDRDYYEYDDPEPLDDNDIDFFRTDIVEERDKIPYLNNEPDDSMSGVSIDVEDTPETVETDNKFLLFNHTCTGYTTRTWDREWDGQKFALEVVRREYKDNPFLLFNRTCTGYTTHNIDEYFDSVYDETDDYDIMKDVIGNAFSLQYNQDGSITYNYTMFDCESETRWSQQSETTLPGLVKENEWNVINVRFTILDNSYTDCITVDEDGKIQHNKVINNLGKRKMKIMIYVNGHLVFISKQLNEFRFRELDDEAERQEGVPYNISLGGGTQGLGERVWLDYTKPVTRHYFLEENYGGSFIGDVRSFKMFECMQNLQTIIRNYNSYIGVATPGEYGNKNYVYVGTGLSEADIINDKNKHTNLDDCFDLFNVVTEVRGAKVIIAVPVDSDINYEKISIGDVEMQFDIKFKTVNDIKYRMYISKAVYASDKMLTIKASKKG